MKDAATRDAYGQTLVDIGANTDIVVLDSGVSDSTRTKKFGQAYPIGSLTWESLKPIWFVPLRDYPPQVKFRSPQASLAFCWAERWIRFSLAWLIPTPMLH